MSAAATPAPAVTLVPGVLRGFRAFHLRSGAGLRQLRSPYVQTLWPLDEPLVAECLRGVDPPCPRPPGPSCTCGIYAWHTGYYPWFPWPLVGVIEASGRVVLGDLGFRAERARVVALSPSHSAEQLGQSSEAFARAGITVHEDLTDMLGAFPPQDVSGLS